MTDKLEIVASINSSSPEYGISVNTIKDMTQSEISELRIDNSKCKLAYMAGYFRTLVTPVEESLIAYMTRSHFVWSDVKKACAAILVKLRRTERARTRLRTTNQTDLPTYYLARTMLEKIVSKNIEKKALLDIGDMDEAFEKTKIIRKAFGNTLQEVTILQEQTPHDANFLQVNLGRVKEAQNDDQTAIEENIDVVVLASYTKALSAMWFEGRNAKATIYIRNAVLLLGKRDEAKENFVVAEVVGITIYSNYSPQMWALKLSLETSGKHLKDIFSPLSTKKMLLKILTCVDLVFTRNDYNGHSDCCDFSDNDKNDNADL
uniref:Uncharacterized protein n=1 Tax=Glossina pallidipes TaxID=7398 RepID=A0A1A9ZFU3_GLOPL